MGLMWQQEMYWSYVLLHVASTCIAVCACISPPSGLAVVPLLGGEVGPSGVTLGSTLNEETVCMVSGACVEGRREVGSGVMVGSRFKEGRELGKRSEVTAAVGSTNREEIGIRGTSVGLGVGVASMEGERGVVGVGVASMEAELGAGVAGIENASVLPGNTMVVMSR